MSSLLFESLTAEPEETITRLQAELELEIHRPASIERVNASHQVETIEDDVSAWLHETLRPEAEGVVKFIPGVEKVWPTLG